MARLSIGRGDVLGTRSRVLRRFTMSALEDREAADTDADADDGSDLDEQPAGSTPVAVEADADAASDRRPRHSR
jgi:hypothetical protein